MTDLPQRSALFAQEINDLLGKVLVGSIPQVQSTQLEGRNDRYVLQPPLRASEQPGSGRILPERVPLLAGGVHLADLHVSLQLALDHTGKYLKTTRSDLAVFSTLDRNPLVRLEYDSTMRSKPVSHWQVHAERGAFSHLLSTGHASGVVAKPHDLSSLHLPTGGDRLRPCLEDLLEFLIVDCGIDHHQGWKNDVSEGREGWRRRQIGAAIRDAPSEAVRVLTQMGYAISPPNEVRADKVEHLQHW